ncbi:MAG: RNA methyltransferase [Actinobacteria bacterium]|nr:RNA methyltransferase [Actinomycetota bacterium]
MVDRSPELFSTAGPGASGDAADAAATITVDALVSDPADERVAAFMGLRDRDLRLRARATARSEEPQEAVFVAEGDPVVARAVRAGYRLITLLADATRTQPFPDGVAEAAETVYGAGPAVLERITGLGVHRGCLGLFARRELPSVHEVIAPARRLLVMERVVNPINLGVIVRSAVGLGLDAMVLDEASVDPLYRRASRVAMGEVFDFPYARVDGFPEDLQILKDAGFVICALTPAPDAVAIDELSFDPDQKVALLLGSEGPGLTAATMAASDHRVVIPLSGRVDSLNVGAAAAIACYAITRA